MGRNGPNDREQRARERERHRQIREQQIFNAIVQQVNRRANANPNNNVNNNNNLIANVNNPINNPINNPPGMNNPEGQQNPAARAINVVVRGPGAAEVRYHSAGAGNAAAVKRKSASYGPESVEMVASTEIEQETFAFLWTLKSFSAFGTDEIKSPLFKGGQKSNHCWQLKMSPKKKVDETEYFSVHLILASFGDGDSGSTNKVRVRFQISLVDPDGKHGKQAGSPTMNVCEFKRLSVWGYDKFITTQELHNPARRLVEDDVLRIHCRVWIEGELRHTMTHGGMAKDYQSPEQVKLRRMELLSKDMKNVMDKAAFTDVTLVTKSKTKISANKSQLAGRSRVFEAMFQSKMLESAENIVEICDFEDDVIKAMIEYIYTGDTPALNEKAPELMQIAEKYELMGLKEDCEHAIALNLTIENAAEVLVLAHLHCAMKLKPKVLEFINRNKEEVRKTEVFNKVAKANPAVFVDLYLSQK